MVKWAGVIIVVLMVLVALVLVAMAFLAYRSYKATISTEHPSCLTLICPQQSQESAPCGKYARRPAGDGKFFCSGFESKGERAA